MFTDVLLCYPPNHLYFEQKVTFVKSLFFKVMTSSMFYLSLGTLYVLEYMGKYIWENCLFTINVNLHTCLLDTKSNPWLYVRFKILTFLNLKLNCHVQ